MREQEMIGGYRLLKRLGAGGAATVWLACDEAGERVALKILHPALAADEGYRERLLREARTVNSIRGGGVAHILDIEIDATQPFVVSEYIPGPTLSELLARGALNIGGVAAIGGALAQTLEDVHARRIIHRDVKASNVICSPRGPVLIDFGIAMGQDEARLTQTGLVSGTAGYTAPELLRGGRASAATDWWGWTATLLTALTGRPPYGEGATEGILDRVLKGEPDTRGLDPRVASLMRMALHPDAHVRPSPDQVVRELAQWGKFRLSDMAVYGGSMAWEGLNWARLLAPATSSQAPTVVAGLSEGDEGDERFVADQEHTSLLEPADADATRVMESGFAEDPSYVDPEATQVYPQTAADPRGWEGRGRGNCLFASRCSNGLVNGNKLSSRRGRIPSGGNSSECRVRDGTTSLRVAAPENREFHWTYRTGCACSCTYIYGDERAHLCRRDHCYFRGARWRIQMARKPTDPQSRGSFQ